MLIAELDGLLTRRDREWTLRPQVLALTAAGRWAFPHLSCGDFARTLDAVLDRLGDRRPNLALGRQAAIVLDWSEAPIPSVVPPESSLEWRNLAHRYACKIWDHALSTAVQRRAGEAWTSERKGSWRHWRHAGGRTPDQGWKLHVSATTRSAPAVLEACAEVLTGGTCAFKHAATLSDLEALTARDVPRSQGGKFITIYPQDVDQARWLAERLHEATRGLKGPRILSDMPYCRDSLVHYRFGACARPSILSDNGRYEDRLCDPTGAMRLDERKPWYVKPSWVDPLFPEEGFGGAERGASQTLAQRYRITGAIRHSFRGGVFRAQDLRTDKAVILKQARPHTEIGFIRPDAPDALRREARNLASLDGIAPSLIEVIESLDHVFLVQAEAPGVSLMDHVRDRLDPTGGPLSPATKDLVVSICALLAETHRRGVVFRDFTPANIMIAPDTRLWLIDAEMALTPDAFGDRSHTPGFAAPEVVEAEAVTPALGFAPDLYALGCVLYFLVIGGAPPICVRGQTMEVLRQRWRIAVRGLVDRGFVSLARLVLRLADPEPTARPSVEDVLEIVSDDSFWSGPQDPTGFEDGRDWASATRRRVLEDGRRLVADSAAADGLANISAGGRETDPCNVQHGAAGLLDYLCRLPADGAEDPLEAPIRRLTERILSDLARRERLLPGLYYGAAGAAWAALSAAHRLADQGLAQRALSLFERLPAAAGANPELYLGAAGDGLALCKALTLSRQDWILERVAAVADRLAAEVRSVGKDVYWAAPAGLDSQPILAPETGFAHGVAGIGAFLLAAGAATGRAAYVDVAIRAGDSLLAAAEPCACGLRWRAKVGPPSAGVSPGLSYYHCNGSAGVGSFLVRLWRSTGQDRHLQGAKAAAQAAHAVRWRSGVTACCGLAGCGQFLLDMADFVDPTYADMARDVADATLMHLSSRDGAMFVTDDPAGRLIIDYNAGLAGVLDFLGRLSDRGARPWMVDELFAAPTSPCVAP